MSNKTNKRPGIVTRARTALYAFNNGLGRTKIGGSTVQTKERGENLFIWPSFRMGNPQWHLIDINGYINEGFQLNDLIYRSIMYKYRQAGNVWMRAAEGNRRNPVYLDDDHPLNVFLRRPAKHLSHDEFIGLIQLYQNIAGYAPVYLKRPNGESLPEEAWPLNPMRVYIIPKPENQGLLGYLWVPEGRAIQDGLPIVPEDMAFPKFPNPGDPLEGMGYGFSPISAMARSADVDNMVTEYLKLFFEKGATTPMILKFKQALDDETVDMIMERWQEKYGSYQNWVEPGVLDREGSIENIGTSFADMQFDSLDQRNESRVTGVFGVPPILTGTKVGIENSPWSNIEEARRIFWEDTEKPELDMIIDELNYYIRSDDGAFISLDYSDVPALKRNIPELTTAWVNLVTNGVPKQRAAEIVGLDIGELPDGDVVYMPLNMVAVGQSEPESGTVSTDEESREDARTATSDDRKEKKNDETKVSGLSVEQKIAHWKQIDEIAQSWEQAFSLGANSALENDKRNILALLRSAEEKARQEKATIDWQPFLLAVDDYLKMAGADNWKNTFLPLVAGVVSDQGSRWAVELGMQFNIVNLQATEWFDDYMVTFANPINDTTRKTVGNLVKQGIEEGWSIPRMSSNIETVFSQWMTGSLTEEDFEWYAERMPSYRREAIARTETIRASNAGSNELFDEWGIAEKEWLSTPDGRTRDAHQIGSAWGHEPVIAKIDETFTVGGEQLRFPGDPNGSPENTISCRCTIIPVVD